MWSGMPGVVCSAMAVQTVSTSASGTPCAFQEVARGVGAVDLEALVGAAVVRHQADVVEHRAGIEQLAVEAQAALHAGERAEMIDAARMVEEQFGLGVADELGDRPGELAVGDGGAWNGWLMVGSWLTVR